MRRLRGRLTTTAAGVIVALSAWALPAAAGTGGNPGPCDPDTPLGLEEARLGWDVSFVAQNVGTPLPDVFAFEGGEAMAPGQLMQFARDAGLC